MAEQEASTGVRVLMTVPQKQEWHCAGGRRVKDILQELQMNPEATIAIANGTLLTPDEVVPEGTELEIRSAVSGGCNHEMHQV
ncbi:MAG: thiamine biosynthesis protein ThiS [Cyanobacteria bacterium QS_8_64_29]|nr:MAG: thiamine biosynthesis protein ThiS [Cyanobacteria bacterium QS_8_64_29]